MDDAEIKIVNILKDLKANYFVKCIKLEFEAEGTSLNEAEKLKFFADEVGLNLIIKIGGCEALRDVADSKKLCANVIVAPMIESAYAVKKFIRSINNTFSGEEKNKQKFYVNIETKTAVEKYEEIAALEEFEDISGITLGRSDLACSMGLGREDVNSKTIFEIAMSFSKRMKLLNKDYVIGGGITPDAVDFLKNIPYLNGFETRKIFFDKEILKTNKTDEAIKKAIEFEVEWLKYRQQKFNINYVEDRKRIETFERSILK